VGVGVGVGVSVYVYVCVCAGVNMCVCMCVYVYVCVCLCRVFVFWGKSGEVPWKFLRIGKTDRVFCRIISSTVNAKMAHHDVIVLFRCSGKFQIFNS
jgi:hypothetical protein